MLFRSSGGSGTGAVTFSATGVCSLSGTTVTMTSGTGTCSVTATKAADSTYQSATSGASTVSAAQAEQATLTLTEVQQDKGHKESIFVETETAEPMEDRVKVELIVADRQAQRAIEIIRRYAQVATNGAAGHVSLLAVNEALQIVPRL